MKRRFHRQSLLISLLILLAVANGTALAAVELRFDPPDQTIPLNGSGSLSIMIDDSLDLRTIETWARYDSDILLSVAGNEGQLFTDTGCFIFNDFDDAVPGEWYGTSIVVGWDCWVTGPGELYRWDFQGIAEGWARVSADSVRLYNPDASLMEDVTLPFTYVFVGTGTGVEGSAPTIPLLDLYPNPFNPQVTLNFGGVESVSARITVHDPTGRRLAGIWSGELDGGIQSISWRAEDETGRRLPSGVYLFRLQSDDGHIVTQHAVLLK